MRRAFGRALRGLAYWGRSPRRGSQRHTAGIESGAEVPVVSSSTCRRDATRNRTWHISDRDWTHPHSDLRAQTSTHTQRRSPPI